MTSHDISSIANSLLRHLLEGEVDNPKSFLDQCEASLEQFKRSIDPRFPKGMIQARGFCLLCYLKLKEKLGRDRSYEIMRVVFLTEGLVRMNLEFDTAHGRSFIKLVEKVIEYNHNLAIPFEITAQSEDRFEMRLKKCRFWELCCQLGIPEATTLVCQVDNAFFSSYLPDEVRFSHGTPCTRLVDGADVCHFVFTRTFGVGSMDPTCETD